MTPDLPSSESTSSVSDNMSTNTTPIKSGIGLGLLHPSSSSSRVVTPTSESVLTTYPHLGHYIFTLLASIQTSPPRSSQHPLSVSSSSESDEERSPPESRDEKDSEGKEDDAEQHTVTASAPASRRVSKADPVDKDGLVRRVVELLDEDMEEEVKEVLKPHMGDLGKDDILMEQVCLDCMHRRRDDQEKRPYQPNLTPTRPRVTTTISSTTLRPYTPTRNPSYRGATPLGRPQSPVPSSGALTPTLPGSSLLRSESSPKLSSAGTSPTATSAMLSAKASAFNPSPRMTKADPPLSATTSTFNPSDPWKDAPPEPPRTASPFLNTGMTRTGSSRGMAAAPLFSDQSSPFHSPLGTPNKGTIKMPDVFSFTNLQRAPLSRSNSTKGIIPDDDEEDEFSPFGSNNVPQLRHPEYTNTGLRMSAKSFEPGRIDMEGQFDSSSTLSSSMPHSDSSGGSLDSAEDPDGVEAGTGMTPLDVLHSVFTSVPKVELESALHASGYDFEGAMAILVSQYTLPRSGASTPHRVSSPRPMLLGVGSRGAVQTATFAPNGGYFDRGGRSFSGPPQAQQTLASAGSGIRTPGGLRICRYFLAGECRRSDCRFSHDLDRALCRFWLRGNCAKGPNCEFLHQLPPNMPSFDPRELSSAMSRLEVSSDGYYRPSPVRTPTEEFPDLMGSRARPGTRFDPSRNRFANALKRPAPMHPSQASHVQVTGSRMGLVPSSSSQTVIPTDRSPSSVIPLPRPSTRIKLRPPTLLPTLKTGSSANEQYMASRQTALRLGHARNACLARAADAFRRGDGAAAKRFSREGKSLNEKMTTESAEAAIVLVRDRRVDAQRAVRERDSSWSDDPMDRSERGKPAGGGLGVILGVSPRTRSGAGERGEGNSSDERMEALLDLHTLHGSEGVEVLGQFLSELERENFRGLTYILVGEEKHVGMQDPSRGASKTRLGGSIKSWLTEWGYAWMEGAGWVCVDSCRY